LDKIAQNWLFLGQKVVLVMHDASGMACAIRGNRSIMQLKLLEHNLVLLPGLDGTGSLFGPLLSVLPPEYVASVVSYPVDQPLSYKQMFPLIRSKMPWDKPVTLVAESFSGPLAVEFAAAQPESVQAVVLVCTFVVNPVPGWLKWAQSAINGSWLKTEPPESFLRKFLVEPSSPQILVDALKRAIHAVSPEVLLHRFRQILDVDARMALQSCRQPMLYLLAQQDKLLGKRGWETIAAFRPRLTTVVLDGPHLLLQCKPRECFTAMEKFFKGIAENANSIAA
jgi:pimeloyl-ACP methyl ester carboxylesterase